MEEAQLQIENNCAVCQGFGYLAHCCCVCGAAAALDFAGSRVQYTVRPTNTAFLFNW